MSISDANLQLLTTWPPGTQGYEEEMEQLRALRSLCDKTGYGRVPQMVVEMEGLWRDGLTAKVTERYDARMEQAQRTIEHYRGKT